MNPDAPATIQPTPPRTRRRWMRLAGFVAGVACGVGVVFLAGFAYFASYVGSLSEPRDLGEADAIIVLTGGHSRIDAAVDLLRAGKGARLLISGVNPVARREDLRAATGADGQLFNCCVDIDHAALDTVGNAAESAKWVREHAYDRVILVTNNYHMPRSLLEMRRLIGDAELDPYPVVNTRLDSGGWLTKPKALRVLMTEYTKYLAALVRIRVGETADQPLKAVVNARSPGEGN
jgi:uncharacterized SAM-binding protein YcdF (DUF218 family)